MSVRVGEVEEEKEGREEEKKREGEKEENETMKIRCVSSNLADVFDIFSQGEDRENCDGFSWGGLLEYLDDLSGFLVW